MNPTVVDRALRPPRADAARPILHGWPQHWYAWRKVIPLLGESHRLISPDLRGFGWTDAPRDGYSTTELADDLLALLDTLELDRVLVVDHERPPGRLGFELAVRAPSRVRRLLTLNAIHPYWSVRRLAPHAWRYWWTVFVETPLIGRTLLRRVPAFTRMLLRFRTPDPATRSAAAVEEFIAPLREPARGRAAELAGAPLEPSQPTSGRSEAPRAGARRKSGGPGHDGARAVATLSRPACSRADDRRRSKPLAPIPLAWPRQGTRRLSRGWKTKAIASLGDLAVRECRRPARRASADG